MQEIAPNLKGRDPWTKRPGFVLIIYAVLLHAVGGVINARSGELGVALTLFAWSLLPYCLALLLLLVMEKVIVPFVGLLGPVVLDSLNFFAVFIWSTSSTAALDLFWIPLWNLLLIEPLGLLIGWFISRSKRFDRG